MQGEQTQKDKGAMLTPEILYDIKTNGEKLQCGAEEHKQVEHRVHKAMAMTVDIDDSTDGVRNTAEKNKEEAGRLHGLPQCMDTHENDPSECQGADVGKFFVFFQINGIEGDGKCGDSPNQTEVGPAECGIDFAQGDKAIWGVGAGNQNEYRAMVNDLKDALAEFVCRQTVIDAGHGVEDNHGNTVDAGSDNGVGVGVERTSHDAQGGKYSG